MQKLKKKGISAFIIDKNTEGISLGKKEDKLGLRASDTCQIFLIDVELVQKIY